MREFILRARKAPTAPSFSLDDLPTAGHLEVVASCISNALFYSNHLRKDTSIRVIMEGWPDPPKTLHVDSATLGSLDGFDERSIASMIQDALSASSGMSLRESREFAPGITVSKAAFEHHVQGRASAQLYYLSRKGADIREVDLVPDPIFVFSDHLTMPKKSEKYLDRLGATPINLGPRMLFASHCIVLVHNELDRRESA